MPSCLRGNLFRTKNSVQTGIDKFGFAKANLIILFLHYNYIVSFNGKLEKINKWKYECMLHEQ